jgi:polygalacturonase
LAHYSTYLWAATLNVPADFATIQAAINASADGDTVLVTPGTYFLNGTCTIPSTNGINFL